MKKIMNFIVTVFLFLFIPCVVNAATEYTVTVKPTHNGDILEHVTVMISRNNETVTYLLTDHEGKATVKLEDGTYEAIAGYDLGNSSYAGTKEFTVSGSDTEVEVEVDSTFDWNYAKNVYNKTTYFNHVDVRVNGTYTTGTVGNTTTHSVKLKKVKVKVENNIVRGKNNNFTADFSNDTKETYEWREDAHISKSAKIILEADVYLDNVKVKEAYQYIIDGSTPAGVNAFIQSIIDCDGNQGLDFVINPREIIEEIFYEVSYEWTGLPTELAELPTKIGNYAEGDNHTIDAIWKPGYHIVDEENKLVYTFTGWTHTSPAANKSDLEAITSGTDKITVNEDTIIHGKWTVKALDTPLNHIEIKKEFVDENNIEINSNFIDKGDIYFVITDKNNSKEIVSYKDFVNGVYLFPIYMAGEYIIEEVQVDIPGFDFTESDITTNFVTKTIETNKITVTVGDINNKYACTHADGCSGTVEFTNEYTKRPGNEINKYYDLNVLKEDANNGTILEGAEFTLTNGSNQITKITNASGFATFEDLQEGTYELEETKAPTGYVRNENVYEVIVTKKSGTIFDQIQNAYVIENDYIITINNLHYNSDNQRLTVYNHLKTTDLTITKEVEYIEDNKKVDTPTTEANNKYSFKVTIGEEIYEFALAAGESKTFEDIVYGTTYKVEEIIPVGATWKQTIPTNSEGTIGEEEVTVKVVNTYAIENEDNSEENTTPEEPKEPGITNPSGEETKPLPSDNVNTNPKTGDGVITYIILMIISLLGLGLTLKPRKINQ